MILHLIDSAGLYGAETVTLSLLEQLQNSDYQGILGCLYDSRVGIPLIAEKGKELGLQVELFAVGRGIDVVGLWKIATYIKRRKISIVHTHGYKPNILMWLLPRKLCKRIVTIHGWAKDSGSSIVKCYEFLDALAVRGADQVIAVSDGVKSDLMVRGIPAGAIRVVHNGIKLLPRNGDHNNDCERAKFRRSLGLDGDEFVIGTVGRLSKVKGQRDLIEAFSHVRTNLGRALLLIAGEGPLRDELEQTVKRLNLTGAVKFLGFVSDIPRFLGAIDIFAMSSYSEGMPVALLEALAASKPVLATRVGGIPEVICNTDAGILVGPGDIPALANGIIALSRDTRRQIAFGETGRKIVEKAFSVRAMAQSYVSCYQECLT